MGYESGPQRWAGSRVSREDRACQASKYLEYLQISPAKLCTLPSTGILALPFFLLHLLVCTSVRHEPELEIGSVHADAGYAKSV